MSLKKQIRRLKIRKRIRKIVKGDKSKPRLSIFRSNKEIYAQLIDDLSGKTIVSASSREKKMSDDSISKSSMALLVGKSIGSKAIKAGINMVKFDRGGYLYHGRVKKLAEGAREAGLKF
tara:strand:+ start:468 stop:824 length:357 start_codon:yes stop_codon:yes gene_type:complete